MPSDRQGDKGDAMEDRRYHPPLIHDYGSLVELTEASGLTGPEDGGSKMLIHHESTPGGP